MAPIVTLTLNPALDKSTAIDYVVPEHKLRCDEPKFEPGGGGINVSRAIHKLGGTSKALYLVGGYTGRFFQQLLTEEGLNHRPIPTAGMTRESFSVLERASGQQYRFSVPGPAIQEDEWRQLLATLRDLDPAPAYIVASGSLPPGVPQQIYREIAEIADGINAHFVVDTWGPPLKAALAEGVYLIKPNMRELGILAGHTIENELEMEAVAMDVIARGQSRVVVVSLGAGGAMLFTEEGWEHIRAPTVPIASKVGAGDSMVGGIVLSLARGNSLHQAVQYGVAAGAAAVMTAGTQLCRQEDTERLYREIQTG